MSKDEVKKKKIAKIVLAYPFVLILIGLVVNLVVFGVEPAVFALPSMAVFAALVVSAIVLLANHTWLMTSTELTRLKHNMRTTPEEWEASEHSRDDVTDKGKLELERRHNAHRNETENVVQFVLFGLAGECYFACSHCGAGLDCWICGWAVWVCVFVFDGS